MKKILLIITIIFCIFQMIVLAIAIDIGEQAINRGSTAATGITWVSQDNPANASGKITSIEIWANSALVNCEVATFFVVSGNNLSTRDTHSIGAVTSGSKQTFSGLDIDVEVGDYIGVYYTAGALERDTSGYPGGLWYRNTDAIPCTNETFTEAGGDTISLYGTGTTAVGWPHKWNTQTISKWNTKEFTKWNGLE